MDALEFTVVVIAVSVSGVLAPGPLFAAAISYGLRSGARAGLKMATGHAIVELPLIMLLGIGAFSLEAFPEFRTMITILGAFALFVFAGIQIREAMKSQGVAASDSRHGPLVAGVVLSALNPFFIIWWLVIGFKLISDAVLIWSFMGILIMFGLHVWLDFAWMGAISFAASKSKRILTNRSYKIVMIVLGGVLIYFGITFLNDALSAI